MPVSKRFSELFVRSFARGSFLRNVTTLSSGSAIGNVILLLSMPVISRIYEPDAFGVFSLFLSLFSIVSVFATLNLQVALPLPKREGTAINLAAASTCFLVFFSALLALSLVLFSVSGLQVSWIEQADSFLVWLPVAVLSAGLNVILYYLLLRRQRYGRLAAVKVGQSSTMAGSQVLLGLAVGTANGLVLGHILSQAVGAVAFFIAWMKECRQYLRMISLRRMRRVTGIYRDFISRYTPGYLVSTLSVTVPPIFFASNYSIAIAGGYAFANRSIRGGLSLIVQSVTRVAYIECVELEKKKEFVRLRQFFVKLCAQLTAIGAIPFSILFFFGENIFALVFGESWREAGRLSVMLVPSLYAFLVLDHSLQILVIMKRQTTKLLWELFRFGLICAVFAFGRILSLDATLVVLMLSLSHLLAYLVAFLYIVHLLNGAQSGVEDMGT